MFKLLKNFRWQDWLGVILTVGLIILSVYLELLIPDYMGTMSKTLLSNDADISSILVDGGYMILCAVATCIDMAIVYFISARISASFSMRLRAKLYAKVQRLSEQDIESFSTASLITRTTNDITQITQLLTMAMSLVFKAPIMAIWSIVKILDKGNDAWTITVGVAVAFLVVTIALLGGLAVPKFKKIQGQIGTLNAMSRENIQGLRVIKAFNAEDYQGSKFDKANEELTKTNNFAGLVMGLLSPVMTAVMSGLPVAIYWIGAYSIHNANNPADKLTTFSNMMVFSSYATLVIMGFLMIVIVIMMSPRSLVAAKRIQEVLEKEDSIVEGSFDGKTESAGEIRFEHVYFGYDNADKTAHEDVLSDISFEVKKGETLAIIGPTGSGKSTIIQLAMRFYDPNRGKILLDGHPINEYTFLSLYNKIALVPQKAVLFNDSIKNNILYGDSDGYSDESLEKAIHISHSEEFIAKKNEGLNSHIEQGGKNVSGGQKQRLSIARALARNPEIIILDDSLSALDFKTDYEVRKALHQEYPETTKIVVAQRIGSIKEADTIIVLENGKILGKGKHEELLSSCPLYKEIAESQLSEEELSHE